MTTNTFDVSRLLAAAHNVVACWEQGDLAKAVRELHAATQQAEEAHPGVAGDAPQHADPLTIAYIAMGAAAFLRDLPLDARNFDEWGGELGFIAEVVRPAPLLERMLGGSAEGIGPLFLYEVAEPFGEEYAQALYRDTPNRHAPEAIAKALFRLVRLIPNE